MKAEKLKAIKHLKTLLGDSEQFVLTGSSVIELQGLTSKVNDIDISLVRPSESTLSLLRRLVEDNPVYVSKNAELMQRGIYIFRLESIKSESIKVDVFTTEKTAYDESLNYAGIIISPICGIVAAKKSYNRFKDFKQLKEWASAIFDHSKLEESIDSITGNDYL
jgi:hypothetical protein